MTTGNVVLICVGVLLQALIAASLGGRPTSTTILGYGIVFAILWGLGVSFVRSKNRDLSRWLAGMLVFGPLAVLIVLLFVPKRPAQGPAGSADAP